MDPRNNKIYQKPAEKNCRQSRADGRREFLKAAARVAAFGGAAMLAGCGGGGMLGSKEALSLRWKEYFKKNYRLMTQEEKDETVRRLERLAKLNKNVNVQMSSAPPIDGVLYGYAFSVTRCKGYMECVAACVKENNLDRKSSMQYIRIFEMEHGQMSPEVGNAKYYHPVPVEDHFYMGVQCNHCQNAPCVKACPVKATWQEPDGIVVVDYDWCIGCRYCMAACPYGARHFNWAEPGIPEEELNTNTHYLGNRPRYVGVVAKCTFCIQRTRNSPGRYPACVEVCPVGARKFGNLLDPDSEIRYCISNKRIFRLKEDLNTHPKFFYFFAT